MQTMLLWIGFDYRLMGSSRRNMKEVARPNFISMKWVLNLTQRLAM